MWEHIFQSKIYNSLNGYYHVEHHFHMKFWKWTD
jgi:hypothetical protein